MNHRLFLMRHAEAATVSQSDRDRPLTPKGRIDAQMTAEKMKAFKAIPDYVICSPARRTRETYDAMLRVLPEVSVIYPEWLYNADLERLIQMVSSLTETSKRVLVIAHNPGIQMLVIALTRKTDREAISQVSYGYKPATLSIVDCDCESWAKVTQGNNILKNVITP